MDNPSIPSRSTSSRAVASTRSRVSLASRRAAGDGGGSVGDGVIAAAPALDVGGRGRRVDRCRSYGVTDTSRMGTA